MNAILEMRGVEHGYTVRQSVLRGLDFTVNQGEIACLLGPSGCGKTTALRIVAGFENVSGGEVLIQGRQVNAPGHTVPPEKRGVGIVFQDAALFPHLNINRNIAFGIKKLNREQRRKRVAELLAMVSLEGLDKRFPHELSGGQRQRAALARAMAPDPALILLDEPFSNLDAGLREQLGGEVRRVLRETGKTAVLVTHDQNEAFAIADRVAVMHQGVILQSGTPAELYEQPVDTFVAEFIGEGDLLPGQVIENGNIRCCLGEVVNAKGGQPGTPVKLLVRPEYLHEDQSGTPAKILESHFRGLTTLHVLELAKQSRQVKIILPTARGLSPGDGLSVRLSEMPKAVFRH
jgi:iron(III) transport system ATP-binding protein